MRNINYKKQNKKIDAKFIRKVIFKIIYLLFWILIIYHLIFITVTTITQKSYISALGISSVIIHDKIMEPDLNKNDIVILKQIENNEKVSVGDIIGYNINNSIRINRVINIINDNGNTYYITKSNANYHEDIEKIERENIQGKIILKIPLIGFLFQFVENKIATIIIILFLLLKFSYNKHINHRNMKRLRNKKKLNDLELIEK